MNIQEPITLGYTKSLVSMWQRNCPSISIEALNVNIIHISGRLAMLSQNVTSTGRASILCVNFPKTPFSILFTKYWTNWHFSMHSPWINLGNVCFILSCSNDLNIYQIFPLASGFNFKTHKHQGRQSLLIGIICQSQNVSHVCAILIFSHSHMFEIIMFIYLGTTNWLCLRLYFLWFSPKNTLIYIRVESILLDLLKWQSEFEIPEPIQKKNVYMMISVT